MIMLFLFELKKIVKSSFFVIVLSLFCLLILGYYVFVYFNTVHSNDVAAEFESRIHTYEQNLQELNDLLSDDSENGQIQQEIQFNEEYIARQIVSLNAYQTEDWFTVLNEEIKIDEGNSFPSPGSIDYKTYTYPTSFTSETRLEYMKWLRDKEIQPVLHNDATSWITVYDSEFGGDPSIEQFIKERSTRYSSSGVYFLYHVFQLLFGLIGPMFFLLLLGDIITKEGLGRNGPIHLLRTQPIHSYHILLSKLIASVAITIMVLIASSLLAILVGTIFNRIGDLDYPVLIYGADYTYSFMKMGNFLLQSALLSFMVLLFCYSTLFLLSIITRRAILAVGLTIAIILGGIQWSGEITLSSIAHYIPFNYFSVSDVITNELAVTLENFNLSFTTGLIVLGMCSLLLYLLTYLISIFQNKIRY